MGRRRRGIRDLAQRYRDRQPGDGGGRGATLPVLHRGRPRRHPGPVHRADPYARPAGRGAAATVARAPAPLRAHPAILGEDRHLRPRRPVAAEDVPWRTTDGRESDYYSVLLTSIVVEGGGDRIVDVDRIGNLLEELTNRGRVTRRPVEDDPAINLHIPGMQLRLMGSEKVAEGPRLVEQRPAEAPKPEPNQMPTTPGFARPSATSSHAYSVSDLRYSDLARRPARATRQARGSVAGAQDPDSLADGERQSVTGGRRATLIGWSLRVARESASRACRRVQGRHSSG